MEFVRLRDSGWATYDDDTFYATLGQQMCEDSASVYNHIMSLDVDDRGPEYTRIQIIGCVLPDSTDTFWATEGQTLSGDDDIYTAIMDADLEYRADEFTRLYTYNWELGYRNTHWGDKAYQMGC